MALLLKDAALGPKIRLTSVSGEAVTDCATYLFNTGNTRLLGVVPGKKRNLRQRVQISFDSAATIYDVRQKKSFGNGAAFETEVEPGVPRLFAMVDRPVDGLELAGPPSVRLGEGVRVEFAVRGPLALRSVARVVVFDPHGKEIPYYGGNQDIVGGKGSVYFRTALDDPSGRWRVSVTEVISDKNAGLEILVK
jgi:hypothetical protein